MSILVPLGSAIAIGVAVLALLLVIRTMRELRSEQQKRRRLERRLDEIAIQTTRVVSIVESVVGQPLPVGSRPPFTPPEEPREAVFDVSSSVHARRVPEAEVGVPRDAGRAPSHPTSPAVSNDTELGVGHVAPQELPYSEELVRQLFARWCTERIAPQSTANLDVAPLRYLRSEASVGQRRTTQHVMRDSAQVAEFARFSPRGGTTGLVVPNPEAHFTPVVAHVFPGLTRSAYEQRASLSALAPVPVRRRGPSEWELA